MQFRHSYLNEIYVSTPLRLLSDPARPGGLNLFRGRAIITDYARKLTFMEQAGRNRRVNHSCASIEKSTGIKVARFHFSDPQGGKGPCDRLAATYKSHICVYINEGHDVTNAEDMKTALLSHRGVTGVRVAILPAVEGQVNVQQQQKIPGISKLNNFQYRDGHLLAWRAYGIVIGKRVVDKITGTIAIINTRWASSIGNLKVIKLFSYCCYLLIENNNARVSMKIENYC